MIEENPDFKNLTQLRHTVNLIEVALKYLENCRAKLADCHVSQNADLR
jgi:hypothetical protein